MLRIRTICLIVVNTILPGFAAASDVGYRLEPLSITSINEPIVAQMPSIEIKDRVWAAPGIEELVGDVRYRSAGRWCIPRRFINDKYALLWPSKDLWPRTREICELEDDDGDLRTEYQFGGLTLQR